MGWIFFFSPKESQERFQLFREALNKKWGRKYFSAHSGFYTNE